MPKTILPSTKLKKWKILQSTDITTNKYTPLSIDKILLPKGLVLDFHMMTMGPAVMIFPFTKEGDLVLVRQYKHGARDIIIEGAAGMVEKNQTIKQAAVAELEQEAGIKVNEKDLITLGKHMQSPTKNTHQLYGFVVFDVEFNSKQNFDEHEDIEIIVVKPKDAVSLIMDGTIWASDTVAFILKLEKLYPKLFK